MKFTVGESYVLPFLLPKNGANAKIMQNFGQLALPAAYDFLSRHDLQATFLHQVMLHNLRGETQAYLEFYRRRSGTIIRVLWASSMANEIIEGDGLPKVSKFKIKSESAEHNGAISSWLPEGAPFFWPNESEAAGCTVGWSHSTREGPSIEVALFKPTSFSRLVAEFGCPRSFEVKEVSVTYGRDILRKILPRSAAEVRDWWRYFLVPRRPLAIGKMAIA